MRPHVYEQLSEALVQHSFDVELDVYPERDDSKSITGSAFRLRARRQADGQVIATSHWTPTAEAAARSLATNMLMMVDEDVRAVVDKVQL